MVNTLALSVECHNNRENQTAYGRRKYGTTEATNHCQSHASDDKLMRSGAYLLQPVRGRS
jgi:hypothetical protein